MRFGADRLVALAEAAETLSSTQWSIMVLQEAYPGLTKEQVLGLPLSKRDALLLALRPNHDNQTFYAEPACDACDAQFELCFASDELGFADLDLQDLEARPQKTLIDGVPITLRPVRLDDLLVAESNPDPLAAAAEIAARTCNQHNLAFSLLETALEKLDPLADIWIDTQCPECAHAQSIAFDPVLYLAREFRQRAGQILQDVVDIARAFHWPERDVLALSEPRRAYYVAQALA